MRQALDALGNQVVTEVSRRLQNPALALVRKRRLTMAGGLRCGGGDFALEVQPAALRVSGAERVNVACAQAFNLSPHKSASVVYGVGRNLPATNWSRCDDCCWRKSRRARSDR